MALRALRGGGAVAAPELRHRRGRAGRQGARGIHRHLRGLMMRGTSTPPAGMKMFNFIHKATFTVFAESGSYTTWPLNPRRECACGARRPRSARAPYT